MHTDEGKTFDKRNIERNIKGGVISQKDYEMQVNLSVLYYNEGESYCITLFKKAFYALNNPHLVLKLPNLNQNLKIDFKTNLLKVCQKHKFEKEKETKRKQKWEKVPI